MELDEARERISELLEQDVVPEELTDELSLTQLVELVSEVYQEEVVKVDLASESEVDQQEILRNFVERLALKVGLICLMFTQDDDASPDVELTISAEQLTDLFAKLLRNSSTTVRVSTD